MARARRMQETKVSISITGATHYVLLRCSPASSFMRPGPYGSKIHVQGALVFYLSNHISAWVICENHATLGEKLTRAPRGCIELHRARAVIEEQCLLVAIAAAMAPPCQQPHIKTQARIKNQMVCWCTINFINKLKWKRNFYVIIM